MLYSFSQIERNSFFLISSASYINCSKDNKGGIIFCCKVIIKIDVKVTKMWITVQVEVKATFQVMSKIMKNLRHFHIILDYEQNNENNLRHFQIILNVQWKLFALNISFLEYWTCPILNNSLQYVVGKFKCLIYRVPVIIPLLLYSLYHNDLGFLRTYFNYSLEFTGHLKYICSVITSLCCWYGLINQLWFTQIRNCWKCFWESYSLIRNEFDPKITSYDYCIGIVFW